MAMTVAAFNRANHTLEQSGLVAVTGGSVHYRLYEPLDLDKSKRTPLVIIHGGPGGSHSVMYDMLSPLADERPVLFYDQLGSHYSPATLTDERATLDGFCDELRLLLDHLAIPKASLFGHSWGGAIAAAFAIQHQHRVESLILSSPLLSTKVWIDDARGLLKKLPQDIQDIIAQEEAKGTTNSDAYRKAEGVYMATYGFRRIPSPASFIKHRAKWNQAIYERLWGASEFSCTGLLKDLDLFPALSTIKIPTTLLCGDYDMATPETMRRVQSLIPSCALDIIPACGHVSYVDQPDAIIDSVTRHFTQIETLATDHP